LRQFTLFIDVFDVFEDTGTGCVKELCYLLLSQPDCLFSKDYIDTYFLIICLEDYDAVLVLLITKPSFVSREYAF
jgi:hypothetical protein